MIIVSQLLHKLVLTVNNYDYLEKINHLPSFTFSVTSNPQIKLN